MEQIMEIGAVVITVLVGFNVFATFLKKGLIALDEFVDHKLIGNAREIVKKAIKLSDIVLEFLSSNSNWLPSEINEKLPKEEEKK